MADDESSDGSASDDSQSDRRLMNQCNQIENEAAIAYAERRKYRVMHYLQKKYNRKNSKKYAYENHSKVAVKRLRIEGRFVTKQQAFEILGLTQEELLDNTAIQKLLTEHSEAQKRFDSHI